MINYQNIIDALVVANLAINKELDMAIIGSYEEQALREMIIELGMVRYKAKKLRSIQSNL